MLEKDLPALVAGQERFCKSKLCGWGRYPYVTALLSCPETNSRLVYDFKQTEYSQLIARGLGRSYGDASLSQGSVISTAALNRILAFDETEGLVRCQPGLSFAELLRSFLPRGWFPAVTPGTKFVTMGGALASNIHGKNHHKDGSFVDFVQSFKLLGAGNEILNCSRTENPELFWASAGGMGLTGIISELEIKLKAVESSFVNVKKIPCPDLSATFEQIEKNENSYDYSVSWIDCLASGKNLGRSILILGNHARKAELEGRDQYKLQEKKALKIGFEMPAWLLNRYSIGSFNNLYYQVSATGAGDEKLSLYESFFYPLDFLHEWNKLYGRRGFIQYQCVLPLESSKQGMQEILDLSARRGRSSFLAVLKKFGKDHGGLSFPMPGYTLTMDIPVKDGLLQFSQELDQIVIRHGGRVYLAKDACLAPDAFRLMYPDFESWLKVKREFDPRHVFASSLSERLEIR